MTNDSANIYASVIKRQIYPWMEFTTSPDALLSQFQLWNQKDPGIFIFRICNNNTSIVYKPRTNPGLVARAQRIMSYLRRLAPVLNGKDILLAFVLDDVPKFEPQIPLFAFQTTLDSKLILFPDTDFITHDFYTSDKYLDLRPYETKETSAAFYGSTTGGSMPITRSKIAKKLIPRIRAAEYFKETSYVTFELPTLVQCDAESKLMLEGLGYGAGNRKDWSEQLRHKFIISMDGNGASWSRVVMALKSASVLLKYNSRNQLFFYYYLAPWKHYVPISFDEEVLDVVRTEMKKPGFFAPIARNATDFASKYLTRESISQYVLGLLSEYSQLLPPFSDDLLKKYGLASSYGDGLPAADIRDRSQPLANKAQWKATAKCKPELAPLAIDGNLSTRYTTGASQSPGQWFTVELPEEALLSGLILNAGGSRQDYPRGYTVEVSANGADWGTPVAQGWGSESPTYIEWPPVKAKFVRITQTGHDSVLFWSIHDLNLLQPSRPISGAAPDAVPPVDIGPRSTESAHLALGARHSDLEIDQRKT